MGRIIKDPVKLRQRLLKTGVTTLYLDIYINGRRKYEHLNLFLIPESSRADKAKNRETLRLADAIRAKRVVDVQNGVYGFTARSAKADIKFIDYFAQVREGRRATARESTARRWAHVGQLLEKYCPPQTRLCDVDKAFVQGFKDYLAKLKNHFDGQQPLTRASQALYFAVLKACINQAYRDELIASNPAAKVKGVDHEDSVRVYLTVDELRRMANTPYPKADTYRRAFLFSCLTGLRKSDVKQLRWGDVHQQGDYTRIVFRQKKTGGQEYIDINPQAAELMGARRLDGVEVFEGFRESASQVLHLRRWAKLAGVTKPLTFHCGRHTFAVMMLDLGADIYTVSKLLGHKELATTQIYAKILDKKKQAAAMMIPQIFNKS